MEDEGISISLAKNAGKATEQRDAPAGREVAVGRLGLPAREHAKVGAKQALVNKAAADKEGSRSGIKTGSFKSTQTPPTRKTKKTTNRPAMFNDACTSRLKNMPRKTHEVLPQCWEPPISSPFSALAYMFLSPQPLQQSAQTKKFFLKNKKSIFLIIFIIIFFKKTGRQKKKK